MKKILLCLFLVSCISGWAQQHPGFKPLRFNDDFSYLQNDSVKNWYDSIKYIPLSTSGKYYISLGGEARGQYISTKNNKWGDEPDAKNGYFLSRYLFHTDIHLGNLRVFGQFQSSLSHSLPDPSPIDKNTAEVHQLFADYKILNTENTQLLARLGRQEMQYGSQRLIGVREKPNNRLAMDGLKFILSKQSFQTDAFYMQPVANIPGAFNDEINDNAKLWGSYTVLNNIKFLKNIDLYYFGSWKRQVRIDDATGGEMRHTFGTRVWKNKGPFQYDFEAVYQFGRLAGKDIAAWTVSSNINYNLESVMFKPTFGLKTEIISGDNNKNDNKIQTFNALYPRGAYFGLVALIGPANLCDIHPSVNLELTDDLSFGVDYDIFWRLSNNDGIYAPNMQLLYSGDGTNSSFIGTQLAADFEYSLNTFVSFALEGAWFGSGSFLKEAGSGKDYLYGAFTTTIKF